MTSLSLLHLSFNLTLLSRFASDERSFTFSLWETVQLLHSIEIFTDKERNTYTQRLTELYTESPHLKTVQHLLTLDAEDLNEILEEPPIKMKRYQRLEFLKCLAEVRSGSRTQPDQASHTATSDREVLHVPIYMLQQEIKGMHKTEWPLDRERPECHVLIWYLLKNREKFTNKTIVELGAGAHGAAGLALAKLDIARHVLITEGTNDENIMNLLIQNCRNSNSNSAAADAVSVQKFQWDNDQHRDQLMSSIDHACDIIMGSDILNYTLSIPIQCLTTVCRMMEASTASRAEAVCYISHNLRLGLSHLESIQRFAEEELGMVMKRVDPFKRFLPTPIPPPLDRFDKSDIVLLVFQLKYPN